VHVLILDKKDVDAWAAFEAGIFLVFSWSGVGGLNLYQFIFMASGVSLCFLKLFLFQPQLNFQLALRLIFLVVLTQS